MAKENEAARARLSDGELDFFENIIALSVDVVHRLKPAVVHSKLDDLDLLLEAIDSALKIRRLAISEMNLRKQLAKEARQNGDNSNLDT